MEKNHKHPRWSDEGRREAEKAHRERDRSGEALVVLGSASPWRLKVLADAGVPCRALAADIDEKAIRHADPRVMTRLIAMTKASVLLPRLWNGEAGMPLPLDPFLLVTADQVVTFRGAVREKPRDAREASEWLRGYAGQYAKTVTAVVVTDVKTRRSRHVIHEATVGFRDLTDRAIEGAIARGNVLKSCGAFTIDDPDIKPCVYLPDEAEDGDGADERSSIEGLPLGRTLDLLESFGWQRPKR